MRIPFGALLVGLVACGGGGDERWQRVESDVMAGVSFRAVHGTGEEVWALGKELDIPLATVVRSGGEGWSKVEGSVRPPTSSSIWASSADDIWLAGRELWRWDGVDWASIDVSQALEGATGTVSDVFGTAPDDVWVIAQVEAEGLGPSHVLHNDGTGWVERGDFASYLDPATSGDYLILGDGCAIGADDVWVVGRTYDFATGELHHWDGEEWTFIAATGGGDLVCAAGRPWLARVLDFDGSELAGPDGGIEGSRVPGWYDALFIDEAGDGWIVGSQDRRPQIWRWSGGELVETVEDGLDGLDSILATDVDLGLRAVWQLASGRVFAFAVDGLVYQLDGTVPARRSADLAASPGKLAAAPATR